MRLFALILAATTLLLGGCDNAADKTATETASHSFTFTAIPDQDESRLLARFGLVADYLAAELGVPVRYVPVKSYAAAVTAFRNDEVQLAWFGGLSGVQARRLVPDAQAIAQGVEDPYFKSYFIANSSTGLSPAATLGDDFIQQPSFTFGSKGSTSGRLMPEFFLRERFAASPDELFERVGYSGDHSRTIALVQSGAYATGAVNYKVWERELADGNIDTDKVQVIWETPGYTDYHWTLRGDLDSRFGDGFSARVQQALLELDDPAVLAAFPRSGFIAASNNDYQGIEDTARSVGIID